MTTLFNADFFEAVRDAVREFNGEVGTYSAALQELRDAACELENKRDNLATELQSVLEKLDEARAAVQNAIDELPCEIAEPDCEDVSEVEIDFDAITN
jgi:uncharacterized coiled-coil DUF342 family protein